MSNLKSGVLFSALLAILSLSPLTAAAQMKVGFVNVSRVLEVAPQATDARSRIEDEFAPRDRNLLTLHNEIRQLEDELLRNAAVMSVTERQRHEGNIRQNKRNLKRLEEEFREDLNLRRSQELSALQRKVADVIQKLATTENYDLVFTDGVTYASRKVDMSGQVIEYLENEFRELEKKSNPDPSTDTNDN